MKLWKWSFGAMLPLIFLTISSAQFTACKKTQIVYDTTTVIVHDTTTVIIKDSIYDLTDGLVAYYNFNGGSLKDSSGFNNNISFSNATLTADRFGNPNNAYAFTGDSTYMEVPNSPSLNMNDITIFAIVRVDGYYAPNCHSNQILGKGWPDNIDGVYFLRFDDYNTACGIAPDTANEIFSGNFGDNTSRNDAQAYVDSPKIISGQWYYLVFTYNGYQANFYMNGKLYGTTNIPNQTFTPNLFDLFIGKHEDPSFPYYFTGVIDEIRIYNRALPTGTISVLSNLKE
jgi:hypothetical protein